MTRKHFEAIAAKIKARLATIDYGDEAAYYIAVSIAKDFADVAANDNPRFDTHRFLAACGINN